MEEETISLLKNENDDSDESWSSSLMVVLKTDLDRSPSKISVLQSKLESLTKGDESGTSKSRGKEEEDAVVVAKKEATTIIPVRRVIVVGVKQDTSVALTKIFPRQQFEGNRESHLEFEDQKVKYVVDRFNVADFSDLPMVRHAKKYHIMIVCFSGEPPRENVLRPAEFLVKYDRPIFAVADTKSMVSLRRIIEETDNVSFGSNMNVQETTSCCTLL